MQIRYGEEGVVEFFCEIQVQLVPLQNSSDKAARCFDVFTLLEFLRMRIAEFNHVKSLWPSKFSCANIYF